MLQYGYIGAKHKAGGKMAARYVEKDLANTVTEQSLSLNVIMIVFLIWRINFILNTLLVLHCSKIVLLLHKVQSVSAAFVLV